MPGESAGRGVSETRPSARVGVTVALLTLIYTMGFVDRQIVNILAESLRTDMGLQNWQLGLLTGLAFASLYTLLGLPLAALADRGHRKALITVSVGVWSIFTILCGVAQTYAQLLAMRLGVGVGEAGATPASHAILSAVVPPERRARTLGIFAMGVPLGTFLGMLIGGFATDLWGWRMAFVVAGLPGLLLAAACVVILREPRTPATPAAATLDRRGSYRQVASVPGVLWASAGFATLGIVFYGQSAFAGSFYQRIHAAALDGLAASLGVGDKSLLGIALGIALGGGGLLGSLVSSIVADRTGRNGAGGYMRLPIAAALLFIPLTWGFVTDNILVSLLCLGCASGVGLFVYAPTFAAIHTAVAPNLRAASSAVALVAINLVGYGLGPLLVGVANDLFVAAGFDQAEGLRRALIVVSWIGALVAAACYACAMTRIRSAEPAVVP